MRKLSLTAMYFSGNTESRLVVVDDEDGDIDTLSYVIINSELVSGDELDSMQAWCHDRNQSTCYHEMGIVEFRNRNLLLEFVLKWS